MGGGKEKTDENSGRYVIASSRPPERRPMERRTLAPIYARSFYGANLWDLYSKQCEKIYSSWIVTIRICCNVDRRTHRYIIEELSESLHPKVMLCSRYMGFMK